MTAVSEHGDFTEAGGQRAAQALLTRHRDLDGLVVASDMRQPVEEMASQVTRLLLEQVDGRAHGGPMRMIIPPQLVRRDSA